MDMTYVTNAPCSGSSAGANDKREIEQEMGLLHSHIDSFEQELDRLRHRLEIAMRPGEPFEERPSETNPLTTLGTQIRAARGRVEVCRTAVLDMLSRLELS